MVEAFDIGDVNPNPARFDLKKAEAINADHMRLLSLDDLTDARAPVPQGRCRAVVGDPLERRRRPALERAMPLVAERMNKLTEAVAMLGFLFADEDHFERTDEIDEAGRDVVRASYDALAALSGLDHRGDRGGAARDPGRGTRAQAAQRLRARPGRGHRQQDQPAAVRVAGAARARPVAGAARVGALA